METVKMVFVIVEMDIMVQIVVRPCVLRIAIIKEYV